MSVHFGKVLGNGTHSHFIFFHFRVRVYDILNLCLCRKSKLISLLHISNCRITFIVQNGRMNKRSSLKISIVYVWYWLLNSVQGVTHSSIVKGFIQQEIVVYMPLPNSNRSHKEHFYQGITTQVSINFWKHFWTHC